MSMLTPPGMGGQYRIKGDKYPRMRRNNRRRRIVLAVVASAAAVALIGWGTLQLIDVFSGGGKANAAGPARQCKPTATPSSGKSKPVPKPAQITVNVFNATPRSGLAKKTADELKARGFTIGKVGNATKKYDKKVAGPGVLLGPQSAADTALPVLATQLAGAERQTDTRKGDDVDLIIGTAFKELTKKQDAERALAALGSPSPAPSASCA
ncbi:LytR C-terminal domain-containing protein [Streptomyces himalayensis]|uniref:LytR C-terminal domain-containing protein n=1 Tax=Streptomyces himalayensis subsp. himalayensis TaxID=2756131 RepID=A0A7W0DRT4_9ACTN|nr:LytR C-terminal domain-containing protein [Streptomyces himalayensis]MBA2950111.1 LytR C-terminal domain-containing protein [Streptomyces himalayensis subsp. himalayensis]